eukprot:2383876-Rhodomonas_salina.1
MITAVTFELGFELTLSGLRLVTTRKTANFNVLTLHIGTLSLSPFPPARARRAMLSVPHPTPPQTSKPYLRLRLSSAQPAPRRSRTSCECALVCASVC